MLKARAVLAGCALAAALAPGVAQAAPELSVSSDLEKRRYVASGDRSYVTGFEDGRYYAQGWHIRGEMGGYWTAPLKMLDGLWFGVDDEWVGPATRFTSGWGYVRMDLPTTGGVELQRTEFAPDGHRAVMVGLRMRNPGSARRSFTLKVDAHSELLGTYPWGWTTPSAREFNLQDRARYRSRALVFTERGTPPVANADEHDWAAVVRAAERPSSARTGPGHFGPQAGQAVCQPDAAWQDPCRDSYHGKGAGGQLRYEVRLPSRSTRTMWFAIAGSETGDAAAHRTARRVLQDPGGLLESKIAERERLGSLTRLNLGGNANVAAGIDWSKQNLADSVQEARDMRIRDVDEGRAYPPPLGTLNRARWLGAGWPDYPWLFGTDGEYTAYASVAVGQFEPIMDHLRALRRISRMANGGSGKVVHEVTHDGAIYYGMNSDPGNTDETAKFPSAVATLWRWTGDQAWLDEMYGFSKANMEFIFRELDEDGDLWPEGLGNVERGGMGEEKLDNTVYTIRGLWDLADMAEAYGDDTGRRWAIERAEAMEARFEEDWWMDEVPSFADSLEGEDNTRQLRRHWIGVTPMDVELLDRDGELKPGLPTYERGVAGLETRETPCYSSDAGMFHTGEAGCDGGPASPSEKDIFTLNSAIIAVGEGNYGRLAQQDRYLDANVRLQLEADEQPGAMPERAPAPAYGTNTGKGYTERGMVLQAWGAYGTAWPVVRQQLGLRPDLGRSALEVVPQVPPSGPVMGQDIRLGDGKLSIVQAYTTGSEYHTFIDTGDVDLGEVVIGHTLPRGSTVASVKLNGEEVADYEARETNRGLEVTVMGATGAHALTITTG